MAAEEENMCRVCFGDEDDGPLVQPCACRGSAKSIHKHCLERWRRTGGREDAAYRCGECMDHYPIHPHGRGVRPTSWCRK